MKNKYLKDIRNFFWIVLLFLLSGSALVAQNELYLTAESTDAQCGDTIVIAIKVVDFDQVVALDFSMAWNANILEFTGNIGNLNAGIGLTPFNFGPYFTPDNDTLTFQWFNAIGASLPDSATLFSLTFIVRGNGGIIGNINFTNQYTPIAAGKIVNGMIIEVPVDTTHGVVFIEDEINPQVICPSDTSVTLPTGSSQVIVGGLDPTYSDNCAVDSLGYTLSGATTGMDEGSASGNAFLPGVTQVQYLVTDYAGNTGICAFTVTVQDSVLRLFITNEDSVSCEDQFYNVCITAQNFDSLSSLQFAVTWDDNILVYSGLFNLNGQLGIDPFTLPNFGPKDQFGNLNVQDTLTFSWFRLFPGATIPYNDTLFCIRFVPNGSAGSSSPISFIPTPSLPIEASKAQPPPNIPVTIGVETFDSDVVIFDNVAPEIQCPEDITVYATQTENSAPVFGIDPDAQDNCGIASITYLTIGATQNAGNGSASGSIFNLGVSTVQYLVTDLGGNIAVCDFQVTVVEDTLQIIVNGPVVTCTDSLVEVCLTTTGFNNLASLQFAFTWDPKVLEYIDVSMTNPLLNLNSGNFGPGSGIEDTLTFSWFNPGGVTIADDSILFCLAFNIIGDINSSTDLLLISSPSVPIEASVAKPLPQIPVAVPVDTINSFIIISDDEPPVIDGCPANVTLETIPAVCAAIHEWADLTATDNCTPDVEVICSHQSGEVFPLGVTTVLCTATDDVGLSDTCSFTITVIDTEPPIIICNFVDLVLESTADSCGVTVDWDLPQVLDNCPSSVTLNGPNPGGFYPVGSQTITYLAVDSAGNSSACSFEIFVLDVTAPVVTNCPGDFTINSNSLNCTAVSVMPIPEVTDNCGVIEDISFKIDDIFYQPTDTVNLDLGSHSVIWYIFDSYGNLDSCIYTVTVIGSDYVLSCPSNFIIATNTDSCTANILLPEPVVIDSCGVIVDMSFKIEDVDYQPTDTVNLAVGTHTVVWYIFDNNGLLDSCSYEVTVEGGDPYVLSCPADQTLSASADCDAVATWLPLTWEGEGCGNQEEVGVVCSHESGDLFPLGITVVTCELQGESGDIFAECSFEILVLDNTPPIFQDCPNNLNLVADPDTCGISFFWIDPVALDNCTDSSEIVYTYNGPAQGFLANGVYNLSYTATDNAGNTSFCQFFISVCDDVPPNVLTCPNDIVDVIPAELILCVWTVDWEIPTFLDDCDGTNLTLNSNGQPGDFPVGTTTVTYTATDQCSNVSTCSFTVTIADLIPPVATCPSDITVTSNGTIVSDPDNFIDSLQVSDCRQVRIFYNNPTGADNCSSTSTTQIDLLGLFSGSEFPSGGPYLLEFMVTDVSGNSDTCSVNITVLPYVLQVSVDPNPACLGEEAQLFTETIADATYTWSGPGQFASNEQNPILTDLMMVDGGLYTVSVSIEGCSNTLSGSTTLNILEPPVLVDDVFEIIVDSVLINGNVVINDTVVLSAANITVITQPGSGVLINNFDGTFTYTPEPGFIGTVEFVYRMCYQECPQYCDDAIVTINVIIDDDECKPNNLITPNNDDRNDILVIQCIEGTPSKFPNNSLKIYNQWGDQVYAASPYENNWGGTYQGNPTAPLPDGTYYYVFSRGDQSNPITGFVTILR